jgi:hypothetical protein
MSDTLARGLHMMTVMRSRVPVVADRNPYRGARSARYRQALSSKLLAVESVAMEYCDLGLAQLCYVKARP